MNHARQYFVAITGASGAIYAQTLINRLLDADPECNVILSITENGGVVLADELQVEINLEKPRLHRLFPQADRINYYHYQDVAAPPASGTFVLDATIVVPCTVNTMSKIANGISDSLITRVADVTLKEGRKLIIVPRETPLNAIHLRNMLTLAQSGAVVLPAMPAFYFAPRSIEDLADFMATKICDQFGVNLKLETRWWRDAEEEEAS